MCSTNNGWVLFCHFRIASRAVRPWRLVYLLKSFFYSFLLISKRTLTCAVRFPLTCSCDLAQRHICTQSSWEIRSKGFTLSSKAKKQVVCCHVYSGTQWKARVECNEWTDAEGHVISCWQCDSDERQLMTRHRNIPVIGFSSLFLLYLHRFTTLFNILKSALQCFPILFLQFQTLEMFSCGYNNPPFVLGHFSHSAVCRICRRMKVENIKSPQPV